jgi:hypothetical protein
MLDFDEVGTGDAESGGRGDVWHGSESRDEGRAGRGRLCGLGRAESPRRPKGVDLARGPSSIQKPSESGRERPRAESRNESGGRERSEQCVEAAGTRRTNDGADARTMVLVASMAAEVDFICSRQR